MRKMVVTLTISYDVDETDFPGEFYETDETGDLGKRLTTDEAVIRLERYLWRNHTKPDFRNSWGDALILDNLAIEDITVEMDKTA